MYALASSSSMSSMRGITTTCLPGNGARPRCPGPPQAEVPVDRAGVTGEVVARTAPGDRAVLPEDQDAVAQGEREVDVLLGDEHREARAPQLLEPLADRAQH